MSNKEKELEKSAIRDIIKDQGKSVRITKPMRINPILDNAIDLYTKFGSSNKEKRPDIIEEALIEYIPEKWLNQALQLADERDGDSQNK